MSKMSVLSAMLGTILALLVSVCMFKGAYAADGIISVPTQSISVTAPLAGSASMSYTLVNTGTHAMYFSALLDPSPGRCSKGLESPESIVWDGETRVVSGAIEARCYQQPGVYRHTLRIKQQAGPNDRNFTGNVQYDIPVTITVPFQAINQEWFSTLLIQPNTAILGRGDVFTTTLVVKNTKQTTGIFELKVRFYYEPTDRSMTPQYSGDGDLKFDGKQDWMDLTWYDDLAPGEAVTMTVLSKGGPFVGAYPGSIVGQLPSGETLVKGLVVIKSKPQISSVTPTNALPGERVTIQGKNFLTDVPSGTSAHDLYIWITDSVSQGVNNVYGDSQGVVWEDSSISFLLPANLHEDHVYWLRVYRAGHLSVSEPFVYRTGKVAEPPVPPALQFAMDVNPTQIASGGLFTATLMISNTAAITQTAQTTFTFGGGAVAELLSMTGPGEVTGFGSVVGTGGVSFSNMRWTVDVPPQSSVALHIVMVANEVTSLTEFPGFITWETGSDVFSGSVSIQPNATQIKLQITSGPTLVDINAATCVNGDFSPNDGSGKVLLTYVPQGRSLHETITLTPTSWGASEVCFSLQNIFAGKYTMRLSLASRLSMPWNFVIVDDEDEETASVYLPIVTR